jgi:hypothetical protein
MIQKKLKDLFDTNTKFKGLTYAFGHKFIIQTFILFLCFLGL